MVMHTLVAVICTDSYGGYNTYFKYATEMLWLHVVTR